MARQHAFHTLQLGQLDWARNHRFFRRHVRAPHRMAFAPCRSRKPRRKHSVGHGGGAIPHLTGIRGARDSALGGAPRVDGRAKALPAARIEHWRFGHETWNTRIPASTADPSAAGASQLQQLYQWLPSRRGEERACRSDAGAGSDPHSRARCRLSVARALQSCIQGGDRDDTQRLSTEAPIPNGPLPSVATWSNSEIDRQISKGDRPPSGSAKHRGRARVRGASPSTQREESPMEAHVSCNIYAAALVTVAACILSAPRSSAQPKDAEPATRQANAAVLSSLPFGDRSDFDEAQRGFIASLPDGIMSADGQRTIWSMKPYAFITGVAPATVNPSLWRQAQLNNFHGLFKVADRLYQIRGLDDSNMSIVESDSGLIVIDTLSAMESAKTAMDLYFQTRPQKPVMAVIYSHTHVDHFGGVKGVVCEVDVRAGNVKVFAPDQFMDFAVADNIVAGNATFRRSLYQFGQLLPPGERGQVDAGHGKTVPRSGTLTLIAPTDLIKESYETRTIDGVEIEFHLVPGSEAPAEMTLYFPQFKVLNMAEDTNHTMHNLYTLRGADVRDARLWSRYISEALDRYGDRMEVLIAQHQWPTWGTERITALLKKQRDMYKFIHDQSVRLLNRAYTPSEIAETLNMPASFANDWSTRGYYGTLSHNAKAVYQKYLGWYDANPANLSPLPPVEQT